MDKIDVLRRTTFGQRIAEEEVGELATYFVETDPWRRIWAGDIDIIYGPKGSGKSALYALLAGRALELLDRSIVVASAENPRGTPVFKGLVDEPPTSEREFIFLWKTYILVLIGSLLREYGLGGERAERVLRMLEDARLIPREGGLAAMWKGARDYIAKIFKPESVEGGLTVDPNTGMPTGVTGKITFREPNESERLKGLESVDNLLKRANDALASDGFQAWVLFDRLDVAFAESDELESNALRALFKTYLDMHGLENVRLKIFIRTDIWNKVTGTDGFREASHITKTVHITWNRATLLNLVVRRLINNPAVQVHFGVQKEQVLANAAEQDKFFYRVFPDKVEVGSNKPNTFAWIMGRTRDGKQINAPRELIHLLNLARDKQIERFEVGMEPPPGEALIDRPAIKDALPEVSATRLKQTLYAEYPKLRQFLERLERKKTAQTEGTLAEIWGVTAEESRRIAAQLVDIGFFEKKGEQFWVPFLYRFGLNMVQGAEDALDDGEDLGSESTGSHATLTSELDLFQKPPTPEAT